MEKELSQSCSSVKVVTFKRDSVFYKIFCDWWAYHRGAYPAKELVTDLGFVCLIDEKPIFISFLYVVHGSDSAMQGFQVCAPGASDQDRAVAIDKTTTEMCNFLKSIGYKILVAYPGNKAILKRLLSAGFIKNDSSVTQVIKEF